MLVLILEYFGKEAAFHVVKVHGVLFLPARGQKGALLPDDGQLLRQGEETKGVVGDRHKAEIEKLQLLSVILCFCVLCLVR